MSMLPAQLFAQGLQSGVGTALQIEEMKRRRASDMAEQAFRQLQAERQAQQQAEAMGMRRAELDRLIGRDAAVDQYNQWRMGQAEAEQARKIQNEAADREAFKSLYSMVGGREADLGEELRMREGGMGPPAFGVQRDFPEADAIAGGSDFIRRLALDEKATLIKEREKKARGFSELERLDREIAQAKADLEGSKPGDPNHAAAQSRLLAFEGRKHEIVSGVNPYSGLVDNIVGAGLRTSAVSNPMNTAAGIGLYDEIIKEVETLRRAPIDSRGRYVIGQDRDGDPIAVPPNVYRQMLDTALARKAVIDARLGIKAAGVPAAAPMGAAPVGAGPADGAAGGMDADEQAIRMILDEDE